MLFASCATNPDIRADRWRLFTIQLPTERGIDMGAQLVISKLEELNAVQQQVSRGIITIREALSQRVRILTEVQVLVREMLVYDLGE